MPNVAKYVHDENIRKCRARLRDEADPLQIKLLEKLIEEEEERYTAALRSIAAAAAARPAAHKL